MSAANTDPARPRKDWCRNAEWTPRAREKFFLRLSSVPDPAKYLRRKAHYLTDTNPGAAIQLLQAACTQATRRADRIRARREEARLHLRVGALAQADTAWRDALATCGKDAMRIQTTIEYVMFIALLRQQSRYPDATRLLDTLDEQLLDPLQRFLYHAARALLADDRCDVTTAALDARSALAAHRRFSNAPVRLAELGGDAELTTDLYHRLFTLIAAADGGDVGHGACLHA